MHKEKNYAKNEEMDRHHSSSRIPKLSSQNRISVDSHMKTLTHIVKVIFQNQALSISFMNAASFPLTYVSLPTPHSLKFMITSLVIILKCVCACVCL